MPQSFELGEYLTETNLKYALAGAGCAVLVDVLLRTLRRPPLWLVGIVGPGLGFYLAGYWGWPDPPLERVAAFVSVGLLAGHGFERLRAGPNRWVAPLVLLAACAGVWLAIPENGPAVVVAGAVGGVTLSGRARASGVGYGLSLWLAWGVLIGARPWGWSFAGGLLCLAPLVAVAVVGVLPVGRRGRVPAWPWLVVGSGAVAFVAARWVGVAPDATWSRVVVVASAAAVIAALVQV